MKNPQHSVFSWKNSKQKTKKLMVKAGKTLTVFSSFLIALMLLSWSVVTAQPVMAAAASNSNKAEAAPPDAPTTFSEEPTADGRQLTAVP